MGPGPQFEEFRNRLAAAGLRYSDFELLDASDPDRHIALISRFPIVARHSMADISYEINGVREKVKRGILDVTIQINARWEVRVLGVHLKSKLPSPDQAESLVRRNEAHLLRAHIASILAENPKTNLVVFCDFNETKDQPSLQEILGPRGAPDALVDLTLADSLGDRWTHYWKVDDVYARIDYLLVSRAFSPRVVRDRSYVYRSPVWNIASDHRPVVATFHVPDR